MDFFTVVLSSSYSLPAVTGFLVLVYAAVLLFDAKLPARDPEVGALKTTSSESKPQD